MRMDSELVWTIVSFFVTLMVFSYLFGDNPLFRFVSALFIGVTAGYFAVVIVYQVLIARLVVPVMQGSTLSLVPLLLSGLLLTKLSPRLTRLGGPPVALLVGVGAAVAIGGAVLGTLFGQVSGAIAFIDVSNSSPGSSFLRIAEGVFFLGGTLATLAYFNFGAREKRKREPGRSNLAAVFAFFGQLFIAVTLGAVFAGVLTATITALIERLDFIINTVIGFLG
jgi:hypothetical protein